MTIKPTIGNSHVPPRRNAVAAIRRDAPHRGFTLAELIVVVAVMAILMAIVVPSASTIWAQRNEASSENLIRGMLASARMRAIRDGGCGIFFFVDAETNEQRAVYITPEPPDYATYAWDACDCLGGSGSAAAGCCDGDPSTPCPDFDPSSDKCVTQQDTADRFRVVSGKVERVPSPYRVAALWAMDDQSSTPAGAPSTWPTSMTKANLSVAVGEDTPRYQRNTFVMLFNSDGRLVVGRNVLIHDPEPSALEVSNGQVTNLSVATVTQRYVPPDPIAGTPYDVQRISNSGNELYDMVIIPGDDGASAGDVAANFVSVDGLVVYDDSDVVDLNAASVRNVLVRTGRPYMVSRSTGDAIRVEQIPNL